MATEKNFKIKNGLSIGDDQVISSVRRFYASDGTSAKAAYSFDGESSTGMYKYGSNQIGFTAGGNLMAYIQSGATYGLVVQSKISATGGNSDNWNTAYGWGDHSIQGYLTSADLSGYLTSESDTLASVTGRGNTTTNSISVGTLSASGSTNVYAATFTGATGPSVTSLGLNVKTLDGANDVALLVEKTDGTDLFKITGQGVGSFSQRISVQSQDITGTRIQNWQTAYGWGDHSTQGYLTSADLSGYLTSESDTLASVTGRGNTTTNAISTGTITTSGNVVFDDGQITSNGSALIIDGASAKEVEIKSARDIRLVIDDNDDDTDNQFELYKHSVASGNELLIIDQSGNMTASNNITADGSFITATSSQAQGIYAGSTQVFQGSTRNLINIGTISSGAITSTGQTSLYELTLTGDTDNLTFREASGDWSILNAQQNNGLKIYDGTSGVEINYNGSAVASFGSGGTTFSQDITHNGTFQTRKIRIDRHNETALVFEDSGGSDSVVHTLNDSQGNYNIMLNVNDAGQTISNGDGQAKILMSGHSQHGAVSLNAGPTVATAGTTANYSISIMADGTDSTIRVGNPNNNVGGDPGDLTKVFDNSANAFATSYSVGSDSVISSTRRFYASDGTTVKAAYSFDGDSGTGISHTATGRIDFLSSGAIKAYIKTGTSNPISPTMYVDGRTEINGVVTWTGGSSTNANTAYGWGDHSAAGYLTSETSHADVVVDGDFASSGLMKRGSSAGSYSIVTDNSSNWNTAYGWGDHSTQGYLTSADLSGYLTAEADTLATVTGRGATTTNAISVGSLTGTGSTNVYAATFTGATGPSVTSLGLNVKTLDGANDVALLVEKTDGTDLFKITGQGVGSFSQRISVQSQDITGTRIQNWQTAYGWGDHSTQGYLTSSSAIAATQLTGTINNNRLSSDVLITDGGTYSTGFASDLDTITGFRIHRVTGFTGTDHRAFTSHHNLLQLPNTSSSGPYEVQLAFTTVSSGTPEFKFRSSGVTWSDWVKVFNDGYHPNADKWTTARTLTLTGDVTGSVSWDGSSNVTMTTTGGGAVDSIANFANNRVITASDADSLNGEANLTFDGSKLMMLSSSAELGISRTSARTRKIVLWDNNIGNDYQFYGFGVENTAFITSIYDDSDTFYWYAGLTSTTRQLAMSLSGTGNLTATNNITANGSFITATSSSAQGIYAGSTQVFEGSTRNLKNINNINCSEITTSGTVKIGTSAATGWPINGARINDVGSALFSREGSTALLLNRGTTTRGDILQFYSDEVKCGQIGYTVPYGGNFYITMGNTSGFGLAFYNFSSAFNVNPVNHDGTNKDNLVDLGSSSARFDDIYATNGTIQTSDRNEKQDIQALTDAETRVATACKGLIRRFRWVDSVQTKGDDARYHFGAIAQDVEDAFTAEGLNAGDYALFIKNHWWEYEGVSYPTAEEAPTGAVEKIRRGIRYNQLLAFIISAI